MGFGIDFLSKYCQVEPVIRSKDLQVTCLIDVRDKVVLPNSHRDRSEAASTTVLNVVAPDRIREINHVLGRHDSQTTGRELDNGRGARFGLREY